MTNPQGRPSPPPDQALTERLSMRLTKGEKREWKRAAKRAKMLLSDWIRECLNERAKV